MRHGLTAGTGTVLTGRTPGIPLDDRGREQAGALAARLAAVPLDAIVTSPLERCRQTADAIAAARNGHPRGGPEDERLAEVRYGDWTGKPLKRLAKDPLWRVVQAHPSAVRFPGADGESMPDVQHRAVGAVRDWNARLGQDATYLICSHGDVIKAVDRRQPGHAPGPVPAHPGRSLLADRDPVHAAAAVPAADERHRRGGEPAWSDAADQAGHRQARARRRRQ